jgi:hypothetical protein
VYLGRGRSANVQVLDELSGLSVSDLRRLRIEAIRRRLAALRTHAARADERDNVAHQEMSAGVAVLAADVEWLIDGLTGEWQA